MAQHFLPLGMFGVEALLLPLDRPALIVPDIFDSADADLFDPPT